MNCKDIVLKKIMQRVMVLPCLILLFSMNVSAYTFPTVQKNDIQMSFSEGMVIAAGVAIVALSIPTFVKIDDDAHFFFSHAIAPLWFITDEFHTPIGHGQLFFAPFIEPNHLGGNWNYSKGLKTIFVLTRFYAIGAQLSSDHFDGDYSFGFSLGGSYYTYKPDLLDFRLVAVSVAPRWNVNRDKTTFSIGINADYGFSIPLFKP